MGKSSTTAKNKYTRANYDRLSVFVKKGGKEQLQAAAEAMGVSLNAYVKEAIQNKYESENGGKIDL